MIAIVSVVSVDRVASIACESDWALLLASATNWPSVWSSVWSSVSLIVPARAAYRSLAARAPAAVPCWASFTTESPTARYCDHCEANLAEPLCSAADSGVRW